MNRLDQRHGAHRPGESGQATVELIALLPLLLLTALIAIQIQLFVSTASAAEAAARAGALALRTGGAPAVAATAALPPGDAGRVTAVRVSGGEVRVEVAVPLLADVFGVRPWHVERDATVARS